MKCVCGCNKDLELYDKRGRIRRFIHGHNAVQHKGKSLLSIRGNKNYLWKGGTCKRKDGYILRKINDYHPCIGKSRNQLEHRYVIESFLSKQFGFQVFLSPQFDVHHLNKIKDDNRLENLELMLLNTHTSFHKH